MLYTYVFKKREYIVEIVQEVGILAEVKFLKKVNGGKGRLPKQKTVRKEDLTLLVNMDVAKQIVNT